jgi:hypothetical protein
MNTWIYTYTPPYNLMVQCLISYAQEQLLPLPSINIKFAWHNLKLKHGHNVILTHKF